MPEGPEVETVRRSLVDRLVGATLRRPWVSRQELRTPITARALAFVAGRRVVALGRKGKTLHVDLDDDAGFFVRLGMTGRLLLEPASSRPAAHTHVRIPLQVPVQAPRHSGASAAATATVDDVELRFVDPRRFGEVVPFASRTARDAELDRLGPDGLLLTDADRVVVAAALRRTQRTVKDALLDQHVVAGVGNIYAAEACFVARLSPLLPGAALTDDEARRLVDAVDTVLAQGVRNRGTSFSDYVDGDGRTGDNAAALWVFQRAGAPCRVCGAVVERIVQGARSTFLCPRCQAPPRRRAATVKAGAPQRAPGSRR
jgi:formamidopyrimidine-DNA glycosylase